jgi:hypothetical protein
MAAAARFTVTKPADEEAPITEIREGYGSNYGAQIQNAGKGRFIVYFTHGKRLLMY